MTTSGHKRKEGTESIRCYELDWLRVIAVLVLVFFHSSEIFTKGWFHIKNDETSRIFDSLSSFIYIWHMPLFFLVAGASTWFALEFRSGKEYVEERIYRLLFPLIFGILLLIPPQSYYENVQKINFSGTFLEYYPHFYEGIYPKGNLHWGHLWFLFYLFIFSLVPLKLFLELKSDDRKKYISKFANRFSKGHSIFLLAIPLAAIEIPLRWLFPGFQTFVTDWANVFHYLLIFIYGFLLYSDQRFKRAISTNMKLSVAIAIPLSIGYIIIIPLSESAFNGFMANPTSSYLLNHPETVLYYIFMMVFKTFGEWCWLIALLGYSTKYLSGRKKIIRYPSGIAYPFYIFHQTVLITIGFYIVQFHASIWLKYFIICISTIALTYLCCELAKSNRISRFIIGMK
ncbi:hypothetical protein D1BOALGB6SA_9501 [Olavius sp. associated proteobacterium Delta 1]|nr:hypothetical protein D1BOALGB6SA_9501 [Olavius sp. associated proteobacterium Delta 1]